MCVYLFDGMTAGKYLMGIQVAGRSGRCSAKNILLRELLGKVVLNSTIIIPLISFIMMLVTPRHYTIHDLIGQTRVVCCFTERKSLMLPGLRRQTAEEDSPAAPEVPSEVLRESKDDGVSH